MCKCPSLRLQPIFENTPQSEDSNIHHQMGGIGLGDQGLAMVEIGVKLKNLGQIDAFQPTDHKF